MNMNERETTKIKQTASSFLTQKEEVRKGQRIRISFSSLPAEGISKNLPRTGRGVRIVDQTLIEFSSNIAWIY